MDLSTYTTKEELETAKEELKELIGVNVKIVDSFEIVETGSTGSDTENPTFSVQECDYAEIRGSFSVATGCASYVQIVAKGKSARVPLVNGASNNSELNSVKVSLDSTGTTIEIENFDYRSRLYATGICYKYI